MNQARSPFAQAVIAKHFPEIEVTSAGTSARLGSAYLPEVVNLARRWNVNMVDGYSQVLSETKDLNDCDLVICAEESMLRNIDSLRFGGSALSYEQVVVDPSFMPRDPVGLRGRYLASELAKVASANIRAVNTYLGHKPHHPIVAVVPESESAVKSAIDFAMSESAKCGGMLIDADLRAPLLAEFRKRELRVGNFSQIHEIEKFDVLSSMSEQSQPEKLFLDDWWSSTINKIALIQPVVLITSPQIIDSGPLPDAYLATAIASKIEVIRR
jgi:protein-tyrosine-phosphatase